jgi:hypothetical protein
MARECIQNCWRIQQALDSEDNRRLMSGPLSIHPDYLMGDKPAEKILAICEASYDCPGPGTTEVDVVKGFISKRTVTETVRTCGLPDEYFDR